MKILILIPNSFPYNPEHEKTFLQHEIYFLSKYFDKVIIYPQFAKGEKEEIIIPNVKIDLGLAEHLEQQKYSRLLKLLYIFNLSFYKEIFYSRKFYGLRKIKKTISFLAHAEIIRKWFKLKFNAKNFINDNILIYTYWTTSATFGLSKLKKEYNNIEVISRAHGIDLYEERGVVCCRGETLRLIVQLHTVSLAGFNYLSNRYPICKEKIIFSPLGVTKKQNKNSINDTKKFVLVSCSQIIDIKRVDLIAKALSILSKKKNTFFENLIWHHFGDGELKEELKNIINVDTELVEVNLMGYINNDEIIKFYSTHQVNLFITTTSTEGGRPVSIQEALSFGIPVLATKVGGIPEIIDDSVGKLLNENPTPQEIADAILYFINNSDIVNEMRYNAIKKWENELNSDNNFENFARKISELI